MMHILRYRVATGMIAGIMPLLACVAAIGQSAEPPPAQADTTQPSVLPQTVVTARKDPETLLSLPVSATAVPIPSAAGGELTTVRDSAIYAPSVFMNEFSARAVSNPFFRGIGGSPANPGVTTYIDGVPQLNSFSSNIELLDISQVEFIRGPQGALFGRNTPGGLINISSRRPAPSWTGEAVALYGNYAARDFRAHVSGPLHGEDLSFSFAGGYAARQGYTRNTVTGDDVDSREAWFGKTQILFQPGDTWEGRLILTGEQDRDGDYALGDLDALRRHPHRVTRDFTDGYVDRDLFGPTLQLSHTGERLKLESISGFVYWENQALTDLDYGVASITNFFLNATRQNEERQHQVTQEFRVSSAPENPLSLNEHLDLSWQSGLFLFYQDYEQSTLNTFAPPLNTYSGSTESDLLNRGLGLYGQLKAEVFERLDITAGLRLDIEEKDADLASNVTAPVDTGDTFSEVSPQFGLVYHVRANQFAYGTISRGYKAGGFNPPPAGALAPAGSEQYDAEHTWNYEVGYKVRQLEGRLEISAALFYTDWDELQLNQQYPGAAGQYFIGNAGAAATKGMELELQFRPARWLDLFGSASAMEARFQSGSTAYLNQDENVGGNRLPYAPVFKGLAGSEIRWEADRRLTVFARAQVTVFGDFEYDASNAEGQQAYSLADFRAGLRGKNWFIEGWAANAFDREYIPIAIPYGQLGAPSGYIGENGAPATFGIRGGLFF